jgi:glycosyltransferase involved in cell wall biosynthesis
MDTREGVLEIPNRVKLVTPMNVATLHRQRRPNLRKARYAPMISVIIPAHNEEAYLRKTLDAVNRQIYRPYEIIVVANGCSDRTPAIARGRCHNLLMVREKGLSRARNLGAYAARGELLIFLDADTILEWDALDTVAQQFTRDYAAGTLKGKPDADRLIYRLIYLIKNFQHRWSLHEGSSGVIVCWKDDFEAMGGFDEDLEVMENSELIRKLRSLGKYLYVDHTTAVTSMRRYDKSGVVRACKLWCKLWIQSMVSNVRHKHYETVR